LVVPTGIFTSSYGGKSFLLKEDGSELKEVWTNKAEAYMSSPVVIGGYIYLHLRNQRFACIDIATGDAKWTTTQSFGKYWSMIAQGDKILALDQRGVLRLIKANPEKYELISERKVSDQETWGHLGLSGDTIFIRDLNGLNAWEWSHGKPAAPASE
jgi:outer membrane protein assembly factor BamB